MIDIFWRFIAVSVFSTYADDLVFAASIDEVFRSRIIKVPHANLGRFVGHCVFNAVNLEEAGQGQATIQDGPNQRSQLVVGGANTVQEIAVAAAVACLEWGCIAHIDQDFAFANSNA